VAENQPVKIKTAMEHTAQFPTLAAHLRWFFDRAVVGEDGCMEDHQFGAFAMDLFRLQFEASHPYRRWCESFGKTPGKVEAWKEIPALPVAAFKEMEVTCLPAPERTHVFRSSGTTGRGGSRHIHGHASLGIYAAACWAWFARHLLPGIFPPGAAAPRLPRLLCLAPGPDAAPDSSLVFMMDVIRERMNASPDVFAARVTQVGHWEIDTSRTMATLENAISTDEPVVVLGTAFSFVHLLDFMELSEVRFCLPAGSCLMETGGYKGRSRELSRSELHESLSSRLGISPARIVSEYGMSELSSQAYDTIAGVQSDQRRFSFPPWVRVMIINPETGREAGEGEMGLIRVLDLANVYSVMAVQTEDLGKMSGGKLEMLGRAAMAELRGCSLRLE
jgi:hypothetical protein